MNGENFILDTNIIIDIFKNKISKNEVILKSNKLFIPIIVLGELLYGAENSNNSNRHYKQVIEFIEITEILYIDEFTANFYAEIKTELKKGGNPIPENDIWIAAISKQNNITLLTKDKHFNKIKKLEIKEI